jgi:hypothetical protein
MFLTIILFQQSDQFEMYGLLGQITDNTYGFYRFK